MKAYDLHIGDRVRHYGHQWSAAIVHGTATVEHIPHEDSWRPDRTVDIAVRLDKSIQANPDGDVPTFANWDSTHILLASRQGNQ